MKIVITERTDDIHACIEGRPEHWDCGKTVSDAIGKLIMNHHDHFSIEILDNRPQRDQDH